MRGLRRRRWTIIKPALAKVKRIVFAGEHRYTGFDGAAINVVT